MSQGTKRRHQIWASWVSTGRLCRDRHRAQRRGDAGTALDLGNSASRTRVWCSATAAGNADPLCVTISRPLSPAASTAAWERASAPDPRHRSARLSIPIAEVTVEEAHDDDLTSPSTRSNTERRLPITPSSGPRKFACGSGGRTPIWAMPEWSMSRSCNCSRVASPSTSRRCRAARDHPGIDADLAERHQPQQSRDATANAPTLQTGQLQIQPASLTDSQLSAAGADGLESPTFDTGFAAT
jgi:hypothetical protein